MKKISTLILIAFISIIVNAQTSKQKLDSIIFQDNYNGEWTKSKSYVYTYDEKGIQTQEKFMINNTDGGMDIWKQVDYSHDADNKLIQRIISQEGSNDSQELVLIFKEDITYNSNGLIDVKTMYLRDYETAEWAINAKTEYEYNASNQLSIKTKSYWDAFDGLWVLDIKDEFFYEQGLLISDNHYDWQDEQWKANSKNEYSYREDGKISQKILFDKFGLPDWIEKRKIDYIYDENGNKIQEIAYSFSEKRNWIEITKYEYSYDADNNMNEYIIYSWQDNSWAQREKFTWDTSPTFIYDDLILPYFDNGEAMIDDGIHLYPMGNIKAFFNNMLKGYQSFKWLNNSWIPISQSSFQYSQFLLGIEVLSKKVIKIFPNPASKYIVLETKDNAQPIKVKIFDINGKLCLTKELTFDGKISISNFKSGMYFYQLINDKGLIKGKLMIQ